MERILLFGMLTIPLVAVSRKSLFKPGSHGFCRFLAWEGILWMGVSNYRCWFDNPFSIGQCFSWVFLFFSLYLVLAGFLHLKKRGMAQAEANPDELLGFERTSRLVDTGIYRYIRHPMYSSLLFLAWGIFLKHPSGLFVVVLVTSFFLWKTALTDEKECIARFGESYKDYMKRSRRFVPYLF